ncbi:DUF2325 domain-containing protein [Bacillus salitolerans]|uniref:DUF2325 domain-containing protein n=1 Tax=Bacillus salitolerans TaxID=1437434 RepID=A0ABW4LNR7_9BACI
MKKPTIAVFGGSQEATLKKLAGKYKCNVLFHCGKSRNGGNKNEFKTLIKKADSIVVQLGAIGHVSMDLIKEVAKELNKPLYFNQGMGASGAIKLGLGLSSDVAA